VDELARDWAGWVDALKTFMEELSLCTPLLQRRTAPYGLHAQTG
jgi:hypothetical protein